MATSLRIWPKPLLSMFIFILALQTHLSLSLGILNTLSGTTIHDLLLNYGLPKGLIPNIVQSYTLSDDGNFQIFLHHPCYVQFDQLVYYEEVVKGKLRYGSASDVSGIQAKMLFVWMTVTGIDADFESGMVEFHVGFLSKKLPAKQFQEIPSCENKACSEESTHPESIL